MGPARKRTTNHKPTNNNAPEREGRADAVPRACSRQQRPSTGTRHTCPSCRAACAPHLAHTRSSLRHPTQTPAWCSPQGQGQQKHQGLQRNARRPVGVGARHTAATTPQCGGSSGRGDKGRPRGKFNTWMERHTSEGALVRCGVWCVVCGVWCAMCGLGTWAPVNETVAGPQRFRPCEVQHAES